MYLPEASAPTAAPAGLAGAAPQEAGPAPITIPREMLAACAVGDMLKVVAADDATVTLEKQAADVEAGEQDAFDEAAGGKDFLT